jgi:hypothetical protein
MSSHTFDVLLAGNYLTTLVAACELARSGKRVCVLNPTPSWGGHFTRLQVGNLTFDPGAVSHEFTAFNAEGARDPLLYDSRRRSDVGRFIQLIEEYTRSHIDLAKMPEPKTVYGGQLLPDIVMSNRLDLLHHPVLAGRVNAEQAFVAESVPSELHPRHKKTSLLFLERSYYEASVANHGATLHSAIFEPMFYKMSAVSSTRLIALYHRIAWLPLYYPETLRSQFTPRPQALQETFFCYPRAGYIGAFGEALVKRMQADGVTVLRDPIESLEDRNGSRTIILKDGSRLEAPHVAWSLAHDQLFTAATGEPTNRFERWSATLVFTTVPRAQLAKTFSVLYAPDDSLLFYRASNQSISAGLDEDPVRIVVEVNPDYAAAHGATQENQVAARVQADLARLGVVNDANHVHVVGTKTLRNVLLLPCRENWKLLERERDVLLDRYPNTIFTRNVEAFFTDTLNDQIIKGLKLAAQLKVS